MHASLGRLILNTLWRALLSTMPGRSASSPTLLTTTCCTGLNCFSATGELESGIGSHKDTGSHLCDCSTQGIPSEYSEPYPEYECIALLFEDAR